MKFISAQWPAPAPVHAITTTRLGGVSTAEFSEWNLATHVGDNPNHVAQNRQLLLETLDLPAEPLWLEQSHSTQCVNVDAPYDGHADAAITRNHSQVLAILTADCLPILLCDQNGQEIAAIHAGWRGLANGIIDKTLKKMRTSPSHCLAWIGPAICGHCYAIGEEVMAQVTQHYPFARSGFQQIESQWFADLPEIATSILQNLGVTAVFPSQLCTFESTSQFYSYRRAAQTGRMATLIWIRKS